MCRLRKLYAAAGERMRKIFGGARRKFESSHQILKKGLQLGAKCGILNKQFLGMAQIGSALPWGGRGRRFKSGHSDQYVKTAFRYCGEPFFSCRNILTQKSSEMIGAFGFILHLRKLCKFCFQCRIDLCVKLVVFLILRCSLCFRLLYLVGLYYCLTSFRY